jgi:hypothetical protein
MPGRPARRLDSERRVDDLDGALDARVVSRAQTEAHERQRVEADHERCCSLRSIGRPTLDRDEPVTWRRGIRSIRLSDAHIIPVDAVLPRQLGS